MIHLDLFSGIGGFAYAADQVFGNVEHIFCDNDKFCQQVLNKHWKDSYIYDDIRSITADSYIGRYLHRESKKLSAKGPHKAQRQSKSGVRPSGIQLLTGGFPCQPYSQAGLRRGTADDRHLWPEMLRVIRLTQPSWVIAENVRGLLTWNEGLVFEQVCTDLEAEGYEVQPFIIPAVAVNAPHRRDRVWFVAHRNAPSEGLQRSLQRQGQDESRVSKKTLAERRTGGNDAAHSRHERQAFGKEQTARDEQHSWSRNWLEVATELCGVDDGLPAELDGFKLTKAAHRKERLKSLGNAIVPQVAMEIMEAML